MTTPCTREITVLIARAATLDADEIVAMRTEWRRPDSRSYSAALRASEQIAGSNDRELLGSHYVTLLIGVMTRNWEPVSDAIEGLILRDLISPDGFTQEYYDILTGPWRKVIGKAHSDDAEVES